MDELQKIWKRHVYIAKASTAFIYGVLVSIAMNFFWEPGHIYSSGITGLAQLLATLTANLPVHLSTALLIFILNVPLFILAWFQIGRRFTFFTVLAVFCSSLMIVTSTDNADTRPDNLCSFWCCDQRFWNWLGFEKWDLHWWLGYFRFDDQKTHG